MPSTLALQCPSSFVAIRIRPSDTTLHVDIMRLMCNLWVSGSVFSVVELRSSTKFDDVVLRQGRCCFVARRLSIRPMTENIVRWPPEGEILHREPLKTNDGHGTRYQPGQQLTAPERSRPE